jgi:hypothetical protein
MSRGIFVRSMRHTHWVRGQGMRKFYHSWTWRKYYAYPGCYLNYSLMLGVMSPLQFLKLQGARLSYYRDLDGNTLMRHQAIEIS